MHRKDIFLRIGLSNFIIGGFIVNFVFAQVNDTLGEQRNEATQMLNVLEGKDVGKGQGDELDFLLDELAEGNGFIPLGFEEAEILSDSEKVIGLEEQAQDFKKVSNNSVNTKGESLDNMQALKEEFLNLKKELERVNQNNAFLKVDLSQLSKKRATRQQNLSKENSAQIYEKLGTAYTQAKVYSKAIEAYSTAIKLNPKSSKAHHDLGLLYEHFLGDSKKAIYHLRQYLKLSSDFKDRERVAHLIRIIKKEDIRDGAMR